MNEFEILKRLVESIRSELLCRFVEIFQESCGVCENLDLGGDCRFVDSLTNKSDAVYSDTMFMRSSDLAIGEYEVFKIQTKSFGAMDVFVSPLAVNKCRTVAVIYFDELIQAPEAICQKLNELHATNK